MTMNPHQKFQRAIKTMRVLTALALCLPAMTPVFAQESAMERESSPVIRPDTAAFLEMSKSRPRPPMTVEALAQMRKIPPEMLARGMAILRLIWGLWRWIS